MTKAATSNSLEQVSPESPSCSTSTSSTEVYNTPLGQGGEIFVNVSFVLFCVSTRSGDDVAESPSCFGFQRNVTLLSHAY